MEDLRIASISAKLGVMLISKYRALTTYEVGVVLMKKYISIFVALIISHVAFSGEGGAGTISSVRFMSGGQVLFHVSGSHSNPPSCPGLVLTRWAFNGATPEGKVQLSGVLTAYATGKKIQIYGTGDCSVWADTETISYFVTVD